MNQMSGDSSTRWASLRDFFGAVREILIVGSVLLLVLVPTKVRQVLDQAGIRSVAGIEFDLKSLNEAQAEMSIAQTEMEDLRQQLALTQQNLVMGANTPEKQVISQQLRELQDRSNAATFRMGRAQEKYEQVRIDHKLKQPSELFDRSANANLGVGNTNGTSMGNTSR